MKKNLFYFLLAALCTVSFTACSSDDDNDNNGDNGGFTELEHVWELEPTVMYDESGNVTTNPDDAVKYTGSVQIWRRRHGTSCRQRKATCRESWQRQSSYSSQERRV